ncbi:FG-GAP repeat domain-containing protein [Hymenobacter monticola]|uniref:VCBS repeat-containing protein n=1 Tax=Hymenobacter monticola TaxID=1705399 RepID=A0ABY4BF95_9BACT|nr:VCBS repeat-containing protein [Hymenobacter monticola]UOE35335.1 VCBS repeat-containing protein [Hymenobacter monticola]
MLCLETAYLSLPQHSFFFSQHETLFYFYRESFLQLRTALLLALGAAGPVAWGQSFAPKIDFPTGTAPNCVALGDVNGDGRLDMVTGSGTTAMASVLPGQAGGGFGPKADFTTTSVPHQLVLGDINGDGRLDVVVANFNARRVDTARVAKWRFRPSGRLFHWKISS